ncbi:MAG: hypothetical protein R2759_15515 [Bacteroidales bacterium]
MERGTESPVREALSIYDMQNDLWQLARIHNDMGVTYMSAGKLDSALMEHQKRLSDIRLKQMTLTIPLQVTSIGISSEQRYNWCH